MISFFNTIASLDKFFEQFPDQTIVGVRHEKDGVVFIDDYAQIEWVYINEKGEVVGDEAEDYKPKEKEYRALMIS